MDGIHISTDIDTAGEGSSRHRRRSHRCLLASGLRRRFKGGSVSMKKTSILVFFLVVAGFFVPCQFLRGWVGQGCITRGGG